MLQIFFFKSRQNGVNHYIIMSYKIKIQFIILKLRHQITMEEQTRTRDCQRSMTLTAQSLDQSNWSQSNHTYYYSKFQLFQDNQEINQFYRYSLFLGKLSEQLDEQWRAQAQILCQPYFNSQDIFMNLLTVWLQLHPVLNTLNQNPLSKQNQPVFNNTFVDQFIIRIKTIYQQKYNHINQNLKINHISTKTICMGFFITANQIWEDMFRKQIKSKFSAFSFFKDVSKKIQSSFQPLMVVTQKISNLFGRKKIKHDYNYPYPSSIQNEKMFGDCYMQFRRNEGLQKQLQLKMSQFNLDNYDNIQNNLDLKNKKKIIIKDQFHHSQSPMEKNMLGHLYQYVTKFITIKYPWQVASSFVTHILDLNQQNMNQHTKIKVLKPAQDFYQKLVICWLMLVKCQKTKNIDFQTYLSHIKLQFGRTWRQKYIIPTKYFYQRLTKHWLDIHSQTLNIKLSQKQILNSLINKIRQNMRNDWQRKIKIQKKRKS